MCGFLKFFGTTHADSTTLTSKLLCALFYKKTYGNEFIVYYSMHNS